MTTEQKIRVLLSFLFPDSNSEALIDETERDVFIVYFNPTEAREKFLDYINRLSSEGLLYSLTYRDFLNSNETSQEPITVIKGHWGLTFDSGKTYEVYTIEKFIEECIYLDEFGNLPKNLRKYINSHLVEEEILENMFSENIKTFNYKDNKYVIKIS